MANSDGNQNWLALYREAVLEPDRKKVKIHVAQPQMAIQRRARELWYAGAPETQAGLAAAGEGGVGSAGPCLARGLTPYF
jgi:hypothetical protein